MKRAVYMIVAFATCTLILVGCAAQKEAEKPVFYPAPPELPRLQYLTSFTGARDVEGDRPIFEAFITGEKSSRKKLQKPYGVAIYQGKIYVCDTGDTVVVFDLDKKTYEALKGAEGQGKLLQPVNISIDKDGNKYVADPLRKQVVVFDRNDLFVKALGMSGNWRPVDAVPYEGKVYVVDPDQSAIRVFDFATGKLVKTFGTDQLDRPQNLFIDNEGYLYVTDIGRFQVVRFDRDGHFLKAIGAPGLNWGNFARPKGLAVDKAGRLYVADAHFFNVQIFKKDTGQLLTFFGEPGDVPGKMVIPAKVVVDYENTKYFQKYLDPGFEMEYLVLVTNQWGNHMVSVFAFGKEKGIKYPTDEELDAELRAKILENAKKEFKTGEQPPSPEGGSVERPAEKPAEGEKGK